MHAYLKITDMRVGIMRTGGYPRRISKRCLKLSAQQSKARAPGLKETRFFEKQNTVPISRYA